MLADEEIALLRALPLFIGIEPEALRILTYSTVRRSLKPGDILFTKGEYSDGGYLVMDGQIILDPRNEGDVAAKPFVYGKGVLIGQLGLFIRLERPVTAFTKDRASISFISRELMHKVLTSHPASAAQICRNLAKDMAHFAKKLDDVPL